MVTLKLSSNDCDNECLVQALEARNLSYRYRSREKIARPGVAFQIDDVVYFYGSGLRVLDRQGGVVPGPLTDRSSAAFIKRKDLVGSFLRNHGFRVSERAAFRSDVEGEGEVSFVSGQVYQFFGLAGRVIAIRLGLPANVKGDGFHTIAELVELKNEKRRLNPVHARHPLRLDRRERDFVSRSGRDPSDVPEAGRTIFLSDLSNLHQGAEIIDATDTIHPSYIETVERALSLLPGLLLCGANVVIEDANQPATADNYYILELNTGAGFSSHHYPWRGQPRDVAGSIVDYLISSHRSSVPPAPFIKGSNGHSLVEALEARGIAYRYLSPDEITHPRFVKSTVATFHINDVRYYFASGLRVSDPYGKMIPGPLIDGPNAGFVKQKDLTEAFLRDHGFSVPASAAFPSDSAKEADAFFEKFLPASPEGVCVKPVDGCLGRLVHLGIRDLSSFRAAFAEVAKHHRQVLIDEMVRGIVYRFFCLAGRVIAIRFARPANVEGDGIHDIADLVILKNAERQLNPSAYFQARLRLGTREIAFLERAGFDRIDVPGAGTIVFLNDLSNVHQGADHINVTDELHPSYIETVERVLNLLPGLILCGADVVIENASEPATDDNYHILELNCGPGFSDYIRPWRGQPRDVAGIIVDHLMT